MYSANVYPSFYAQHSPYQCIIPGIMSTAQTV